jgi:hypothetical protein
VAAFGHVLSCRRVLLGAAVLLLVSSGRARATPGDTLVIDPEVRSAVTQGPTRVLVELRLPGPSASDTDSSPPRQPAIAAARQTVLARLTGTRYRLVRQYTTIPLLALEIGPEALQALEEMGDVVTRVRAEQIRSPTAPR